MPNPRQGRIFQPGQLSTTRGRTLVRPMQGAVNTPQVVVAASWCTIDLAAPGSTENLNDINMYAASDANNSFDGTSAAKKFIVNFGKPVVVNSTAIAQLVLGSVTNSSEGAVQFNGTWNTANGAAQLSFVVRIRAIIASFVTAGLNWSNVVTSPSITIGGQLGLSVYQAAMANSSAGMLSGPFTLVVNPLSGENGFDALLGMLFKGSGSPIYGVIVDVETIAIPGISGLTVGTVGAALQVTDTSAVFGSGIHLKPRLVLY